MATLFVRHKVADYAKWRKAYNDFDTERKTMGVTSHGVYQLDGDPNDVTVYHEFPTVDAAKTFAGSPRLKEIIVSAGVQGMPDIWFANRD
ncbi:MAG: cyclase [Dehalococcoidia bacterium]|nr:cyclase [Dehalococcoidia bacterium]